MGAFEALWLGQPLPVRSKKGLALIVYLASRPAPVSRQAAAELLWGPRGGRNLRQLLYTLRKLPGSETWLSDDDWLHVHATIDRSDAGLFLEELDGDGFPEAFEEWLEGERLRTLSAAPTDLPWTGQLERLLGAMRSPDVAVLARALEVPEQAVSAVLGRVQPEPGPHPPHVHHRLALAHHDPIERGHHWIQASQPDRAAEAYAEAGDLDTALRIAADVTLRLRLFQQALDAAHRGSDTDATQSLTEALRQWSQIEPDPAVAYLSAQAQARLAWRRGDVEAAADHADDGEHLARQHGLDAGPIAVVRGQLLLSSGDALAAKAAFDLSTRSDAPGIALLGHSGRGAASALLGHLDEALEDHRQALTIARRERDPIQVARCLCNVGSDLNRLGRFAAAARRYIEAVEAAEQLEDGIIESLALANGSINALWAGEFGTCRDLVRRALERSEAAGNDRARGQAYDARSELEAWCGRWSEAVRWADRGRAFHLDLGADSRAALSSANAAIYRAAEGGSVDEALAEVRAFDAHQRPHESTQLALDLALLAHEPMPGPDTAPPRLQGQAALVQLRWSLYGEGPMPAEDVVRKVAETPGHLQALAAAALRAAGIAGPTPAQVLEARTRGLLGAQRDGMAEMINKVFPDQ